MGLYKKDYNMAYISENSLDLLDMLSDKKVLYAEDELEIASNTIEILELYFQEVVHVKDGQELIEEFSYGNYDVLILDICMPNMDGLEAVKQIRKYNHKIPIIILSAYNQQEYLWRAIELKITKYLTKPYDTKSFIDALEKACLELVDYHLLIKLTNDCSYDQNKKVLICDNSGQVHLAKNEIKLLEFFIHRKNEVVKFEDIYEYLWDFEEPSKEAIKYVVKELRKKIGKDFIKNVYGIGYTLEI